MHRRRNLQALARGRARAYAPVDAGADRDVPRHQWLPTWAIPQTLAGPEMVGRWIGMQNFVGNFAGAVAPALTGYLLDRTGLFYWPFFITAGVAGSGALAWTFIVGPIEEVNWENARAAAFPRCRPCPQQSRRSRNTLLSCRRKSKSNFAWQDLRALGAEAAGCGFRMETARTHEMNTLYDLPGEKSAEAEGTASLAEYGYVMDAHSQERSQDDAATAAAWNWKPASPTAKRWMQSCERWDIHRHFAMRNFARSGRDGKGQVVVDETPIGNFCEIEGPPRWIDATAKKLDVSSADYITKNYATLFSEWKQETKSSAREMTFKAVRR